MRIFAVFFCFASLASAYPEIRSKYNELTKKEDFLRYKSTAFGQANLVDTRITKLSSLSDFRIYFYTRKNRRSPVVILNNDVNSIVNSGFFNSSARIISITHGWNNDYSSECNTELTDAILDTHDVNVLVSDWSSISQENYITAETSVTSIGQYLGAFIDKIVSTYKISHTQFTLLGHSLGAHIVGVAGRNTEQKVDLIIGLDPALPGFNKYDVDRTLNPSDAAFVQIIHTCGGYLGFYDPIGHADYYPNFGENFQPGCIFDIIGTCSHGRSYKYLAESIANSQQKFWAFKCDTKDSFKRGECYDLDTISFMGTLEVDKSASGSYWLQTNSAAPYALDYDAFQE